MIRRFYHFPIKHGTSPSRLGEFIEVLKRTDHHIAGTGNTRAGRDRLAADKVVVWENTFADPHAAVSAYMRHPHHAAVLDNFIMPDSPGCTVRWPTFTVGYEIDGPIPALDSGIRRVVLLRLSEGADVSALENCTSASDDLPISLFTRESWSDYSPRPKSGDGKPWTHVWEQGFGDAAELQRYLDGTSAAAAAERDGFQNLGLAPQAIRTIVYEVDSPGAEADPGPAEDFAARMVIQARVSTSDAEQFIASFENSYDPAMESAGMSDMRRSIAATPSELEIDVVSTWELDSIAKWHDVRGSLVTDSRWQSYVRDAMPLVRGGNRWLSRVP